MKNETIYTTKICNISNLRIWRFWNGKKSFKVELSLSAQINNGKSIKVASKKSFCGWFGRKFRIHQRYLCLANYEDKMWGNRSILVLISDEMKAMANVKESQINKEKSTNVGNITCTYTKIWTVLQEHFYIANFNTFLITKQLLNTICCPLNVWIAV